MIEENGREAPRFATLGGRLARELTPTELDIVAGGDCILSYPPVTPYLCDKIDP